MNKYRRIEVKAFRHRVKIVSGEWPGDINDLPLTQTDDRVLVDDDDLCDVVELDSPEGQQILVEAVRSLERRLSPQARAVICADRNALTANDLNQNRSYLNWRSAYESLSKVFRFTGKKKSNARTLSVKG